MFVFHVLSMVFSVFLLLPCFALICNSASSVYIEKLDRGL